MSGVTVMDRYPPPDTLMSLIPAWLIPGTWRSAAARAAAIRAGSTARRWASTNGSVVA